MTTEGNELVWREALALMEFSLQMGAIETRFQLFTHELQLNLITFFDTPHFTLNCFYKQLDAEPVVAM